MNKTAFFCSLTLFAILATPLRAADPPPELQQRLDRLERELETLKRSLKDNPDGTALPADRTVLLLMDNAVLVHEQQGDPNSNRFLVLKISVANLSSEIQEMDRADVELLADGKPYKLGDVPEHKKNTSFPWGMDPNFLNRISPFQKLRLPPNSTTAGWIFVPGLPTGTEPLSLELVWKEGDQVRRLDLIAATRNRMDISVERIGPKQSLGLISIRGEFSGLGAGVLIRELEALAKDRISRVVLAWEPTASPVEPGVGNWLRLSAELEDRTQLVDRNYPLIPGTIQELHLAALPSPDFQPYDRVHPDLARKPKIHSDALTAVRTALAEILERAPREELLETIKSDHRLVRSAALAVGSGRLLTEDLPIVLQAADDSDLAIQEGAVRGLQHFGDPPAVEKLIFWLQKGTEPLSSIAANSLIASRFPAAQSALLQQFKTESVESQAKLLEQLIRDPRPILAEPVYEFVTQHPDLLAPSHLRCLETIGHPQFVSLLQRGLKSEKADVQQEALRILIARNTQEADDIAVPWTLEQIRNAPPTDQMLVLLNRVKPPEAVELLLKHLSPSGYMTSIIATIGLIGDPSISKQLLELYPSLPTSNQAELLTIFKNWEVPEFRELAHQALTSEDPAKVRNAASGLIVEQGGDRGLPWIGEALEQTKNPEIIQILTDVLAGLGNAETQNILRKIRALDSAQHRTAAVLALAQIRQRSPGFDLLQQAVALVDESIPENERNYRQAIGYLTEAIKLDPELFEAYLTRANSHMHVNKPLEAAPDFRKAVEIEPYNADAVTGLCVVLAVEGQWEDALKRLEAADGMFQHELNYQYNSACVYARVVAHLRKTPDIPDRDPLIERYTGIALKRLREAVDSGFSDLNWMQKDPDLESLRESEGFKEILKGRAAPPAEGPQA